MSRNAHIHPADLQGVSRLAVEATLGVTDLVEAVHHTIVHAPGAFSSHTHGPMRGISGLVYRSIRHITRMVGGGLDTTLTHLIPLLGEQGSSPQRDAALAALNGVLGDYLAEQGNPLALPMIFRVDGEELRLHGPEIHAAIPNPSTKILLPVHGLCLNDRHWLRNGHNHAAALADQFGYTAVYPFYNTGLHVSLNGRSLAEMLEALVQHWPVPVDELVIIGHSMGGLVARSACYYAGLAGHSWVHRLRKLIFLGTPHHGAPLERGGNWVNVMLDVSPYTAAFARLGRIRSAGITDLRYGSLRSEDWEDQDRFTHRGDDRILVPLPEDVQCYAACAITGTAQSDLHNHVLGDGLVPLYSALGHHVETDKAMLFPDDHQWVGYQMHHLDLLDRPEVLQQLQAWMGGAPLPTGE